MTRRALVVAYNFPPVGGIGIQRTLKYVTYLPASNWEPVVLTARDPGIRPLDDALLRTLPAGLVVERAFSPEPVKLRRMLGEAVRMGRRVVAGAKSAGSPGRVAPDRDAPDRDADQRSGDAWGGAGRLWGAYTRLAFFPDEQVGWVPFAVCRGLQIVESGAFDAVYSSSSPISCHLVAGSIARATGLPWVADFRDPWLGNAFAPQLPRWQEYMQRCIERAIVRQASAVVLVTDGMLAEYTARYPWAADRFVVIPNGYDRNDFGAEVLAEIEERARVRGRVEASETAEGMAPAEGSAPVEGSVSADGSAPAEASASSRQSAPTRFKFVYAGSVYGERELSIFLEGVELLLARRPEMRERIEIEFIGRLNAHNEGVAAIYDTPERLRGVVTYSPFVPHRQALERMVRADALFHIIADEPGKGLFLSGKLPEYVGLDRQVVAFVPEGAARSFLRELDWGIVEDPTPEGVAVGLDKAVETPLPARHADPEGRYDRANLAKRLAAVLDEVAGQAERDEVDRADGAPGAPPE